MLYWVLRAIARLALRWYYRDITVIGSEHVPARGPAILAANHNNALVDALVVGTAVRRKVRLTAKATLLEHPLTRGIVAAIGIIPLRRLSDEPAPAGGPAPQERNAQAFAAITDSLARGDLVLIFPEGKSHSDPALAPLKTGCARLALQARLQRGVRGLGIVPVGLTFERKGRPRSRVLVHIGPAIAVDAVDAAGASDPQAVQVLTARVDAALREVTLNFASDDDAQRILAASHVLAGLIDRVRPLHDADTPLHETVQVARRIDHVERLLATISPDDVRDVRDVARRLDAFRRELAELAIPVNDLTMSTTLASGAWFAVREALIATVTLPVAWWGRVNHWLPISLARHVGRATASTPDEPAMHTLVSGVAFVAAFYGIVAGALWWWSGPWPAVGYLASLPPSASLDFWRTDRLVRARRRARAYLAMRRDPARCEALRREAALLRAEAARLDTILR